MANISPFLVVNSDEVVFDFVSGRKIVRLRVRRSDIDQAQGRMLSASEASHLVRERMGAIGGALVHRKGSLASVLKLPLAAGKRDDRTGCAPFLS